MASLIFAYVVGLLVVLAFFRHYQHSLTNFWFRIYFRETSGARFLATALLLIGILINFLMPIYEWGRALALGLFGRFMTNQQAKDFFLSKSFPKLLMARFTAIISGHSAGIWWSIDSTMSPDQYYVMVGERDILSL